MSPLSTRTAESMIRYLALMRAVVLREHGGPEVMTIEEVDDPVPGPDQVLVDVAHAALNRADTLQRQGGYPDPVSYTHLRAHET